MSHQRGRGSLVERERKEGCTTRIGRTANNGNTARPTALKSTDCTVAGSEEMKEVGYQYFAFRLGGDP